MDQQTRTGAQTHIDAVHHHLSALLEHVESDQGLAAIDAIVVARSTLDELAILLLTCYLRERLEDVHSVPREDLLEEARTVIARLFNVL